MIVRQSEILDLQIRAAKLRRAKKVFDAGIPIYGSLAARLRSLDCKTEAEAVRMLAAVQDVKIYKVNGEVIVE